MGKHGRRLLVAREERGEALERLDVFHSGRQVVEATQGFIADAEEMITGPKAGRKRLEATSAALASLIDIPVVPEFVEVIIARVIVQIVFSGLDRVEDLVAKVKARRERKKPRSL